MRLTGPHCPRSSDRGRWRPPRTACPAKCTWTQELEWGLVGCGGLYGGIEVGKGWDNWTGGGDGDCDVGVVTRLRFCGGCCV